MQYLDTSLLAAYYCPEPLSDLVEKIIIQLDEPTISHLTEVELTSALSKKIRTGGLCLSDGNRILNTFHYHLKDRLFHLLPVEHRHFTMANNYLARFNSPLRTLDALHLAVTADNNMKMYTADARLAEAAANFGVQVEFVAGA